MSDRYLMTLSLEEKKYLQRKLEEDRSEENWIMTRDLLLRLSGLHGLAEKTSAPTEERIPDSRL